MEKLIYTLSRRGTESQAEFSSRLLTELGPQLRPFDTHKLSIAVHDADVSAAAKQRIVNRVPAIEAVVSLWVHSANDLTHLESILLDYAGTTHGYLVTESVPLINPERVSDGERTPGMLQVAFLRIPSGLNDDEWFSIWRDDHTRVAIETQSTLAYRQNLVVRPLTEGAPDYAAIVEETFPAAAMASQHAFYDAVGDDEKLERNRRRLWESSKRFVDVATIEVVPTSEYVW